MKSLSLLSILAPVALCAQTITSPDGHLAVNVSCQDGVPTYCVTLDADTVLLPAPLGLNTTIGDFTQGLTLKSVSEVKPVSESYDMNSVKKSHITYTANEQTFSFTHIATIRNRNGEKKEERRAFDIQFHVQDNNLAFRYILYPQGDRLACLVNNETTAYTLPGGTTTYLCPQMTPQTGFARTAPSYETYYDFGAQMGANGHGRGFTFPALFKVPASPSTLNSKPSTLNSKPSTLNSTIWVMINETDVAGNYCGSRLETKTAGTYVMTYPEDTEFGGVGTSAPGLMLTEAGASMPWRTITVGRDLAPIAETTIQWDLVRPQYEAKYDYKYGRSAWSWIIRMDASCNFDEQKEYVDFAADMGWEYLLVDAWWDTNIGYDRIAELSRYAATKGVGLFLWYNSNGYWNDAMQGPRGKMHRMITRREEMAWMQQAGIKGIKVDFVGSDKQQTMQMYEDILADANDYGIMVIFHGCTLQRGWERMFPNFVSCEAVRASENLAFGQYDNDIEARCGTIHPVLRNAVGNMDFGGSALNKHYSKNNQRGTERKTSDVYALATAILFQTPVQNFAVAPNNLTDAPAWAIDFMKQVPTTWDDLRWIAGEPGKYLVMARRTGDQWYLAAINADEQPVSLDNLVLDMFPVGTELQVYTDDAQLQGKVSTVKLGKKQTIKKLIVPQNGGLVIK